MRIACVVASLLAWANANAQPADNEATALALFAEARQLAAQDDYIHACEKYEAARSLEPWLGIELNLADCYEHVGRTASAWVLFRKAADEAARVGDPRASYAHDRAEQLAPRLAYLTIRAAPGVNVSLDGKPLPAAALAVAMPIDPGEHVVEGTAPGRVRWSRHVAVAPAASSDMEIPALDAEPATAPAATLVRVPAARSRWVLPLGGAGVAAVVASLALGLDAKLRYDDAHGCNAQLQCDSSGYQAVRDARSLGDRATIVGAVGLFALGAAAFFYLRTPVAPVVGPAGVGITVQGSL